MSPTKFLVFSLRQEFSRCSGLINQLIEFTNEYFKLMPHCGFLFCQNLLLGPILFPLFNVFYLKLSIFFIRFQVKSFVIIITLLNSQVIL